MSRSVVFSLDVLPAKCSVELDVAGDQVRFRARSANGAKSEWTTWRSQADAPHLLVWNDLWGRAGVSA